LANLKFKEIAPKSVVTDLNVEEFLVNEQDFTSYTNPGSVSIVKVATDIANAETKAQGIDALYPNPLKGESTLTYYLDETSKWVNIEIFDLLGQKVALLVNESEGKGTYSIKISNKDYPLQTGTYIIQMKTANFTQTQKFQVEK